MTNIFPQAFFVPIAYLVACIPFGLIIARSKGVDLRRHGSGNIGATNVARVIGKREGLLTLAGDIMKGFLPVLLLKLFFASPVFDNSDSDFFVALTGVAAVLGHCYPIFMNFRGGKGVATALGVYLAVCPASVLFAGAGFFLAVKKWGYVSVASLLAASMMPICINLLCPAPYIELMAWTIALVVWIKHADNLKRLSRGEENRLK
jgi:glycerol-3-phosphate acyltransferase PlsY